MPLRERAPSFSGPSGIIGAEREVKSGECDTRGATTYYAAECREGTLFLTNRSLRRSRYK